MKDQMLITNALSRQAAYSDICEAAYAPRSFWMEVYPPLPDRRADAANTRAVCPWSLAAELRDFSTPHTRRKNILDALRTGLSTISRYHLPAARILFMQDTASKEITVWID